MNRLLKIEEVALVVGCSAKTINMWYTWKRHVLTEFGSFTKEELSSEAKTKLKYTELLPDFIQNGHNKTRYWSYSDIWRLIEFKNTVPHGRNGILGEVTQKYARKEESKCRKAKQ